MPPLNHIHLIAPSYPLPEEDIELTKAHFEAQGMRVTIPYDILGPDLLCANKDEMRLAHLKQALIDSSADVVWLLKGGYGLTRLIHRLLPLEKPQREKLFIGYSDGTALHVFLNQRWNWKTIHGPSAAQVAKGSVGSKTVEAVLQIIRNGLSHYTPLTLKPFNAKAREMHTLSGTLIGGTLSILQCGIGTSWQVNSSDKILFIEDVDERGYRVDRMLGHLQQANMFDDAKAIIFGDFVGGNEVDGRSLVLLVLQRFAENLNLPVFYLPGCGHGDENLPLLFNRHLEFDVESNRE